MARDKLDLYRRKRDFTRTAEPRGGTRTANATKLRYVIHKHAATRLHWDLRLELGGVFKSWAVTRGPSLDPADKRLAVEVEDHPLEYGDFEGTIPKGEYGGGTVQLWDRGYWQPDTGEDPAASLKRGELKFTLDGARLKGGWVLVRMRRDRDGGKRTNWLLIHHGGAGDSRQARPAAASGDDDRSVASGRTMEQIASGAGKGPTPFMMAGKDRTPARRVWTGRGEEPQPQQKRGPRKAAAPGRGRVTRSAIPDFVEPHLCKLVDAPPAAADWIHEIKFDGYRMQLRVVDGVATLRTRKGLDWTERFGAVAAAAAALPDCLIDGELCALDEQGRSSFPALQGALTNGDGAALVYFAFDLLADARADLRERPLRERKKSLKALLARQGRRSPLRYVDDIAGTGQQVWLHACKLALEGIVSKRADAPYVSGRTPTWVKSKCRAGQEVVIGGYTSAGRQLRSLLVGVHRNRRLQYAGRVGTGFGGDVSRTVMPRLEALAARANPFIGGGAPRGGVAVHWVQPALVAEIAFAGWTGDGKVRQASFKGLRPDKPAAEVRDERPESTGQAVAEAEQQVRGAKGAKRAASAARNGATRRKRATARGDTGARADVGGHLTHPEKLLWPATRTTSAATKLDLARYLVEVADWLLEHVRGRPCALVRAPDGIDGQQFFQRHAMAGHDDALRTIKLSGDRQPYLQVDSVDGLMAVAQMAGVELHPGNGLPDQPEVPGRLVFDLDPGPDVEFDRVVDGALELRQRLEGLGLVTFCKSTGGKGLHVVTPLAAARGRAAPDSWANAKLFAQTLCAQMAADSPRRYLINMSKAQRKGRIFLDYLRNDRLALAVAPLSPRARPGATVSMPLLWSQVKAGLQPADFTLRTAPALLARTRPWRDYAAAARPLTAAARRMLDSHGKHAA